MEKEKLAIQRSMWINAPRERVWQAVTDPQQIVRWLMPDAMGAQIKRDDKDTLSVLMGGMEIPVAVLESIAAPRQLTSRSLPDKLLATTYTLDEEKGGTRITIIMTGFEGLPADAREDRFNFTGMAWDQALENLNAVIAGAEKPYPFAGVAPLYGYWREPEKKMAIERSIWIKAQRERVWQAVTDPVQIEKWFSPGTPWELSALQLGGRLFVRNPETGGEMYTQVIELLEPPHKLAMRAIPEPPQVAHVTLYTLLEENGGTRLMITDTGYEQEPDNVRWMNMEQNAFGYGMMLANLKAVVEGGELPVPGGF